MWLRKVQDALNQPINLLGLHRNGKSLTRTLFNKTMETR
jgi:hypothetical protein